MKAIAVFPKTKEVKLIDHPEPRITQPTPNTKTTGAAKPSERFQETIKRTNPDEIKTVLTLEESPLTPALSRVVERGISA